MRPKLGFLAVFFVLALAVPADRVGADTITGVDIGAVAGGVSGGGSGAVAVPGGRSPSLLGGQPLPDAPYQVAPEPGVCAMFGLMVLSGALSRRRRRSR